MQILRVQLLKTLEVPPAIISNVSKLTSLKPALERYEDVNTLIDLDGVAATLGSKAAVNHEEFHVNRPRKISKSDATWWSLTRLPLP